MNMIGQMQLNLISFKWVWLIKFNIINQIIQIQLNVIERNWIDLIQLNQVEINQIIGSDSIKLIHIK